MKELLEELRKRYPDCQFHRCCSVGDFEGREHTIDVVGIPLASQMEFLKENRDLRSKYKERSGVRTIFIFHNSTER